LSIRAFRTLAAVARHGAFARAGAAVGLTQSAVSQQMKTLEREFGVEIFDRSRRQTTFTEAGRILLEKAGEILDLYDRIGPALGDERSLAGRLRLGATETILNGVLSDAIAALHRTHPRVRVHVSGGMSTDLAQKVSNGELDVAVTSEPIRPYPQDLVWSPLYTDRFWVVAPPGNEGATPRDLLTELPFIRLGSSAWAGRTIVRELRRQRIAVRDEMVFDSPEVILRMVRNGLGVAVVAFTEEVRAGLDVACLPFGAPQLERQIVLLERSDRKSGPLGKALADAILRLTARR